MKLTTKDKVFNLEFGDAPLKELARLCTKSGELETGGVLIGYYTNDLSTAVVTELTGPPKDSKRGHSWFFRGVAGLKELLAQRWRQPRKHHYIGEWHYHPANHVEPSQEDITQLIEISKNQDYHCKEPLMIIAGRGSKEFRPLRAFICSSGEVIELFSKNSKTQDKQ